MKLVLQIVSSAELFVDKNLISEIDKGLVAYFCVEKGDVEENLYYFAKRISELRIFPDNNKKANLSIKDLDGEILLIPQFTLAGNFHHKSRPDFSKAETYEKAETMYKKLSEILEKNYNLKLKLGVFGADMIVKQTGIGPFTAYLEK